MRKYAGLLWAAPLLLVAYFVAWTAMLLVAVSFVLGIGVGMTLEDEESGRAST